MSVLRPLLRASGAHCFQNWDRPRSWVDASQTSIFPDCSIITSIKLAVESCGWVYWGADTNRAHTVVAPAGPSRMPVQVLLATSCLSVPQTLQSCLNTAVKFIFQKPCPRAPPPSTINLTTAFQ